MKKVIFRAEVDIDAINYFDVEDFNDNLFLIGVPVHDYSMIKVANGDEFPVKQDTWAINIEGMIIDNIPVFASLDEVTKKGGDILYWHNMTDEPDCSPSTIVFTNNRVECFGEYFNDLDIDAMKVHGIQK